MTTTEQTLRTELAELEVQLRESRHHNPVLISRIENRLAMLAKLKSQKENENGHDQESP